MLPVRRPQASSAVASDSPAAEVCCYCFADKESEANVPFTLSAHLLSLDCNAFCLGPGKLLLILQDPRAEPPHLGNLPSMPWGQDWALTYLAPPPPNKGCIFSCR